MGRRFTRRETHTPLGHSVQSYLPHRDRRVVAACLRLDTNPDAPDIIMPGRGGGIEHAAALLGGPANTCAHIPQARLRRVGVRGRVRVDGSSHGHSRYRAAIPAIENRYQSGHPNEKGSSQMIRQDQVGQAIRKGMA